MTVSHLFAARLRAHVACSSGGSARALLSLIAGAVLLVSGAFAAQAQDEASPPAESMAPAILEETDPAAVQPEAAQDRLSEQAPSSPALGTSEAAEVEDAGMAVEVDEVTTPFAAEPLPVPEPAVAPEPVPSFLEDPAGALSHLMRQAERDPSLPHDLSPWGMFMMADWVVKSVMIGLVIASFVVWTVWLAKMIEIACAKARARRAVGAIANARGLADADQRLVNRGGPGAFMVRSAVDEMRRSAVALDHAGSDGIKERLGARLSRIEAQASRRLSRGTGFLATVGSTAPFIGLFATVWGIMNSFIGISEAQTTNLAVVAPGIAEALLATAMGLVAAIPAVIIYNVFARSIAGYGQLLADAASGVEQLVSLDLDLRKVPANDPGNPPALLATGPARVASVSAAE